MSAVWQVQEAKNRFSELIEQALSSGPQTITRHGRAVVQVVATSDAAGAVTGATLASTATDGFAHYLLSAPNAQEFQLPLRRSRKNKLSLGD